jgi:hypothetical protein
MSQSAKPLAEESKTARPFGVIRRERGSVAAVSRMPDDAYHRTFRAFKPVGWTDPALPLHAIAAFAGAAAGRLPYAGIAAYQIAGESLKPIRIDWRKDQDFEKHATPWEKVHSKLANGARYGADPVVDSDLMVVGHFGRFHGTHVFVPKGRGIGLGVGSSGLEFRMMLDEDVAVFVSRHNPLPSRYEAFHNASDARWWLLTAIDGRVLAVDRSDDRGVEPSAFSPADVLAFGRLIGKLVVTLVGVGGRLVRSLTVRRAARRLTGEVGGRRATRTVGGITIPIGRITVEEMERHLTDVLARRPELRRLMGARAMTDRARIEAIKLALEEWERTQGWKVVRKAASEMPVGNPMTLRAEVRELWINRNEVAHWRLDKFYEETVHEMAAHALKGSGGRFDETVVAFVGELFQQHNNALFILEQAIKTGDLQHVLRLYR